MMRTITQIVLLAATVATQNPTKSIELETLRIKGYIYEPQVLFILEQPATELITIEEKKRHDFLDDIDQPLLELLH